MKTLAELKAQMMEALKKARAIAAKVDGEGRDFTPEERAEVQAALDEAKACKDKIKEVEGTDDIRRQIHELGIGVELVESTERILVPGLSQAARLSARFMANDQVKAWLDQVRRMPDSAKGLPGHGSPYVQFGSLFTGSSDTSGGAMVFNDVQPGVVMLGRRPLTLRDIVTNGTTDSDTVEYVRQTSETNNAAPVAEANATSGDTGTKPESAMAFEKVTTPVRAIGHWVPATKRALADAGQLATIIDSFLRDGVEMALEDQMVDGDGQGENLTGIGQTSGIQTQAWDTDEFVTLRKARTKVRVVGRARPSAYAMNPYNWETIDLKKDSQGRFYGAGPFGISTPSVWGLPVPECEAIADGVAYCGDFRYAVLWDRQQASVAVSDSHSDFFIRGLVAIVAEMRAAFGVLKPKAFVEVDLSERS